MTIEMGLARCVWFSKYRLTAGCFASTRIFAESSAGPDSALHDLQRLVKFRFLGTCIRFCLVVAVLILGQNSASAQSAASGLAALPSSFQGDVTDRAAGLKSWGQLLGSAVVFNQVWTKLSTAHSSARPPLSAGLVPEKPPELIALTRV